MAGRTIPGSRAKRSPRSRRSITSKPVRSRPSTLASHRAGRTAHYDHNQPVSVAHRRGRQIEAGRVSKAGLQAIDARHLAQQVVGVGVGPTMVAELLLAEEVIVLRIVAQHRAGQGRQIVSTGHLPVVRQSICVDVACARHAELLRLERHHVGKIATLCRRSSRTSPPPCRWPSDRHGIHRLFDADRLASAQAELGRRLRCRQGRDRDHVSQVPGVRQRAPQTSDRASSPG